ncbi:hypothetical protein GCM10027417_15280 [Glutamicibacter endophyticus]
MDKPTQCPRCYRQPIVETETRRYIDDENQDERWDQHAQHDAEQRQDLRVTMREMLWSCPTCGWKKVAYSANEPNLGPENRVGQ